MMSHGKRCWHATGAIIAKPISLPVDTEVGDSDLATFLAKLTSLGAAFNGSRLVVSKRAGHSSSFETPALVNDLIKRSVIRANQLGDATLLMQHTCLQSESCDAKQD